MQRSIRTDTHTHRVMQATETREEFCVFTGSESECEDWIDEISEENFPESTFFIEERE